MDKLEPKKRFTDRVENYAKYRPSYPTAVYDCLQEECGLTDTAVIADIGSGTGLFAELYLKQGNVVYGVEPNESMRLVGEEYLKGYANFISIDGAAEGTTLPDNRVDFVTASQAAHWFDLHPTRKEFERILKPKGTIALCWNRLDEAGSAFMIAYETVYNHFSTLNSAPKRDPSLLPNILLGENFQQRTFPNPLNIDFESFQGRLLSSSVMPLENKELRPAIKELFDKYEQNGQVQILNQTYVLFNQLA